MAIFEPILPRMPIGPARDAACNRIRPDRRFGARLPESMWADRRNMNQSIVAPGNIDRRRATLNEGASPLLAAAAGAHPHAGNDPVRGADLYLALDALLVPSPGSARVSKNGKLVIELHNIAGDLPITVGDAERLALAEPEQDWCIHMVHLSEDRHYRREGAGLWKLYARGIGLA